MGRALVQYAAQPGFSAMTDKTPKRSRGPFAADLLRSFDGRASTVETLYAQAQASRWGLTLQQFGSALERSAKKHFSAKPDTLQELDEYLSTLHLEDLALAVACAEGCDSAWEHFFATYRQYLYSAAAAITRRAASDPYAREFADSLYAPLYGRETANGRASLFNHFHGRSKLSTWLRAVLAQRYIDVLRQEKRLESVEDDEGFERTLLPRQKAGWEPADPHRSRYLHLLAGALKQAISSLDALDRTRLISYYLKDLTLAEIGRATNEHEATVSRKLERVRQELKEKVIAILKAGRSAVNGQDSQPGLDDAQIQLCFEYATEAWPFDLSHLLEAIPPRPGVSKSPPRDG